MYEKEGFRKYVIKISIDLKVVIFINAISYTVITWPPDEPVIS
jgi:hypothetical protein